MSASCTCRTCHRHPRRAFDSEKARRRRRREAQAVSAYGEQVARAYISMRLAEVVQQEAFARAYFAIASEVQRRMLTETVGAHK